MKPPPCRTKGVSSLGQTGRGLEHRVSVKPPGPGLEREAHRSVRIEASAQGSVKPLERTGCFEAEGIRAGFSETSSSFIADSMSVG